VFLLASATLCILFYRYPCGMEFRTAYLCGMPGGLVEMVLLAGENGADERAVSLVNAMRVFLAVLVLPFALMLFIAVPPAPPMPEAVPAAYGAVQLAWAVGAALAGVALGVALRLPVKFLLGPMPVSGVLHATGLTDFVLPAWVVASAQVALGATMGCRFVGADHRSLARTALQSCGAVLLLLATTSAFAALASSLSDLSLAAVTLAYSPGGLAEMSFVAFALGIDTLFVFATHICRVVLVAINAGLFLRLIAR
jgi:uncharacterized protein